MYVIEECSKYKIIQCHDKCLYLFDDHNMALPAWGSIASKNAASFPLISFDTHTDTWDPFTKAKVRGEYSADEIKEYHCKCSDFSFEDAFCLAVELVGNEEHILLSCDYGYLSGYSIIFDTDTDDWASMEDHDRSRGYNACYIPREKWNAEYSEIVKNLPLPCILDFDLDYFRCAADMDNNFFASIRPLVKNAVAITIAREPEWFETVNIDPSFTNQVALEMLIKGIEGILESE